MNSNNKQIFFDQSKNRWRISLTLIVVFMILLFLIFGIFLFSIFKHPKLNTLHDRQILSLNQSGTSYELSSKTSLDLENLTGAWAQAQGKDSDRVAGTKSHHAAAFFVNWDPNAQISLKQNIKYIDLLIPEWYHLGDEHGKIIPNNEKVQKQILEMIRSKNPKMRLVPTLNNFNIETKNWDTVRLKRMLQDATARQATINNFFQLAESENFSGININFEGLSEKDSDNFYVFLKELYEKFHPLNLEISFNLQLENTIYNLEILNRYTDYIILLAFDQNTGYNNSSGPLASWGWYKKSLQNIILKSAPEKLVIAFGNYGYDWVHGAKAGTQNSIQQIFYKAKKYNAKMKFDAKIQNPNFQYYDQQGKLHDIWYLDAVTAFNQIKLAQSYQIKKFALWGLGLEDQSIWEIYRKPTELDQNIAAGLQILSTSSEVIYEGEGEVFQITQTPLKGFREIQYNKETGLIKNEQIKYFPSSFVFSRTGHNDSKKIVLSFDDGPDPRFTPKILDILGKNKTPAVFFVTGMNATKYPQIIKKIYQEGHEIGSHTFSHPDITRIPPQRFQYELSVTQHAIENIIGHNTLLFRPPYGEDIEPETMEQIRSFVQTTNLGYKTIGMRIDPEDWKNIDPDKMVKYITDAANKKTGQVVLLHDSGGDRSNTVAALPKIISELRSAGYEFASISELTNKPKSQFMPPVIKQELNLSTANNLAFQFLGVFSRIFSWIFIFGVLLGILRSALIIVLAIRQYLKNKKQKFGPKNKHQPRVSVIVPAYNEEKVICKTVESLLHNTYKNFNVLVVDDGSTDSTYSILLKNYADSKVVRIFSIPNCGKAGALNYAVRKSRAKFVIALDADTIFDQNTIERLVRHFTDPKVAAVAGNAKVGNRVNIITRTQALEYIINQNLDRRAYAIINGISVVPGAVGAWRRKQILAAGGFSQQTMAEDADMTINLISQGYKVIYDDQAKAYTEAPDRIKNFLKQRFRWMFGTLQAAWKHRTITFRPKYAGLGLVTIPSVYIFQILFPLLLPILDLIMILTLLWSGWQKIHHPLSYSVLSDLKHILLYYLVFLIIELLASSVAFVFESKEDKYLLLWLFPQRFFYRQLLCLVALKTVIAVLKGKAVGWNKFERKATVTTQNEVLSDSPVEN